MSTAIPDRSPQGPVGAPSKKELPKFTLKNLYLDVLQGINAMIFDPFCNRVVGPIIIIFSSVISKLIIRLVPYTEIDFSTYMEQIHLINEGELVYSKITGGTGPIVYPAGFVQIYQFLAWVTKNGFDIRAGQQLFSFLFVVTTALTIVVYASSHIQPWPMYLLLLSKRLYSIYVLRLFNDCFTTFCMCGTILLLQQASYWKKSMNSVSYMITLVASDLFSCAISIKMNALLYLPGFLIVTYFICDENLLKMILPILIIPLVQVMVGWKFLLPLYNDEEAKFIRWTYINQAFDFSRKFMYKWTVNWKFLSEETFLSDEFAKILVALHASVLLIFIFTKILTKEALGKRLSTFIKDAFKIHKSTISPQNIFLNETSGPKFVMMVMSTTNIIGVLFSRSLHYQFLSWYCWQLPFMLYSTGWNFIVCFILFGVHEYCWNVFPATPSSSGILISVLTIVLAGVWLNRENWSNTEKVDESKKNQ